MPERCSAFLPENHGIRWPCASPAVVFLREVGDWREGYCLRHLALVPGYRLVRDAELDTATMRETMAVVALKLRQLEEQRQMFAMFVTYRDREQILDLLPPLAALLEGALTAAEHRDA